MIAEEKAKDIFVKMLETMQDSIIPEKIVAVKLAKLHALIAVDEIISELNLRMNNDEYWQNVKQELLHL